MNLEDLTIGQAKHLAAMFGANVDMPVPTACCHEKKAVIVTTDKRGVIFGYTDNVNARPITVTQARMALYWSADVGGVFGLADIGPTKGCKISAVAPSLTLEGVTAIFAVESKAEKAWNSSPVQGR